MTKKEIQNIIDDADVIVGGYTFTEKADGNVSVFGLDTPNHALLMTSDGEVLETNMTDIEIEIVTDYWNRNSTLVREVKYA